MANDGTRQRPASISPLVHDMSTASAIAITVAINPQRCRGHFDFLKTHEVRQRTPLGSWCLCKSALSNNTRNGIASSHHRSVTLRSAAAIRIRVGRVFSLEQCASQGIP